MTGKYDIKVSTEAKRDIQNIIMYIEDIFKEPNIAVRYADKMKTKIKSLEYYPQRYAIIDSKRIKKFKIRKLVIKKYIVFYRVNENKKIVNVDRVLYGASDWLKTITNEPNM